MDLAAAEGTGLSRNGTNREREALRPASRWCGDGIRRADDRSVRQAVEDVAGACARISTLARRRFLAAGGSVLGGAFLGTLGGLDSASGARADEPVRTGQFLFPRLRFAVNDETTDCWDVHPTGDVNLRRKLAELTNINVSQEPKIVTLEDFDDMARHPFVFMTSEGTFVLSEREERNLREYLERGGFILADDCVYNAREDRFFRTYNTLLNKLFPDNPMRKIPHDHELFHCYFDFDDGAPHCQGVRHGAYGLFEHGTGRLMTVNTPGDIHCGWVCKFFSQEKNLASLKMGINIIIYFLTH